MKRKQHYDLEQKGNRITNKKQAIEKYQDFLDRVHKENSEQFTDVSDIINRYDILVNEDEKLGRQRIKMEEELKEMKERKNKYEKEK